MKEFKKHKNLIFDLGMHKGEDTEFYLKKKFKVVAFEANPELVSENKLKFAKEIKEGDLVIVSGAIVSHDYSDKTVRFYKNPSMTVWGTIDEDFAERNAAVGSGFEEIEVPAVDLREELEKFGVPYYMKIDIEGADRYCLDALKECSPKPDYLSLESEKADFEKLVEEIDVLQSLGYKSFKAVQQFGMGWTKEPTSSMEGEYAAHSFVEGASGLFGGDLGEGWKNRGDILEEYKKIFASYRRWGDGSLVNRNRMSRDLIYAMSRIIRKPLPGWYDTHASLHDH